MRNRQSSVDVALPNGDGEMDFAAGGLVGVDEEFAQEAGGEAPLAQAREEVETFIQQAIPDYDAFLLKAGLRIRKAFVDTLTK